MAQLVAFHYQPGDSVLHRLDVRIELPLFLLMVAVTLRCAPLGLSFLTLLSVVTLVSAHLPLRRIAREFRLFVFLLALMFVARAFGSSEPAGGETTWLSRAAFVPAAMLVWRLALLVLLGTLFAATARAAHLQSAVAWYLKPFHFLPGGRIATMVGLTISLIPLIFDSYQEISDAQNARCVHGFRRPARRLRQLVVPLMLKTFGRADSLAAAMESRCYNDARTFAPLHVHASDWATAIGGVAVAAVALLLDLLV